jgi:hypothetical protein
MLVMRLPIDPDVVSPDRQARPRGVLALIALLARAGYARAMAQADRQIAEKDRCRACSGSGWTWWSPEDDAEGKWIICRGCIGTGRSDQKGRKRQKPDDSPGD